MLEIKRASAEHVSALQGFFLAVATPEERLFFAPHPFDQETVLRVCTHQGADLYYLMLFENRALGYGLLRGWDEGFDIPSLGITIHPEYRGRGLGKLLMSFLHAAARLRGSKKIRLKAHRGNGPALSMYQAMGYGFTSQEGAFLVGFLDLTRDQT